MYKGIKEGKLRPRIDKVYPMEGYKEAWDYLRSPRKTHGKVVIEIKK